MDEVNTLVELWRSYQVQLAELRHLFTRHEDQNVATFRVYDSTLDELRDRCDDDVKALREAMEQRLYGDQPASVASRLKALEDQETGRRWVWWFTVLVASSIGSLVTLLATGLAIWGHLRP